MPARIPIRLSSDDQQFFRVLMHYKKQGVPYAFTIKRAVIEFHESQLKRASDVTTQAHTGAPVRIKPTIIGGDQ